MWFCFTVTGAVSALIIIVSLWEKFQTNPTITGLDTDFHNQQVIFPTIALCPVVPYDENRTREVAFGTLAFYEEDRADRMEPILKALTDLTYANVARLVELRQQLGDDEARSFLSNSLRTWVFMVIFYGSSLCKHFLTAYFFHSQTYFVRMPLTRASTRTKK